MRRVLAGASPVSAPDLVEPGLAGHDKAGGTRACGGRRSVRTLHAGCLLLAVLLAATGCFPAPPTAARPGYRIWIVTTRDRDSRPRERYTVVGRGAPTLYAGPVSRGAGQAAPTSRRGRGTCTSVTIRLPGIIVFDGDQGSVLGTVETNLPPGAYTMQDDPEEPGVLIEPWPIEEVVLKVGLGEDTPPATGLLFESYLANMIEPVPLRVIAANAAGTSAGAPCHACTRLEPLATADAQVLLDALSQRIPPGERALWLRWATDLEVRAAGLPGRMSLREQVEDLLATGGPRTMPRWRNTAEAHRDPQLRKSWRALQSWEKDLWRAYLAQQGESMDVTDPARRDLRITKAVRFSMALRMSPRYMAPGARAAAAYLFNDPMFLGSTVAGITLYLGLVITPEPILSKATAVLTTIALVSLAGFTAAELVTLAQAWMRLRAETAQATTLEEIDRAAAHFGHAIGGSALRILAVLATLSMGKALPTKPPAGAAPATVPVRVTGTAGGAAVASADMADVSGVGWAVRVLKDGAVVLMAMSAAGGSGGNQGPGPSGNGGASGNGTTTSKSKQAPRGPKRKQGNSQQGAAAGTWSADEAALAGVREPGPLRSFRSFRAFKRAMGPAGKGMHWHHIVEQTPGNLARFGPEALHNTGNVIRVDSRIHNKISGLYSSNMGNTNMTIRKWLSTQSIEAQRRFGIQTLRDHGVIP